MTILIVGIFYIVLFILVEYVYRKNNFKSEVTRKIIHIIAGVTAAFLPYIISFKQITMLSLMFIILLLISKRLRILNSIHHVKRVTYGEIYFPMSIFILSIIYPVKELYIYGIMIMSLSDALANIIGIKYGKKMYQFYKAKKSYIGSLAFLVCSILISLFILAKFYNNNLGQNILLSLFFSTVLTIFEAILPYGLDNLILPLLAATLLNFIVI